MSDEIARIVSAQRRENQQAARRRAGLLEDARREATRLAARFVEEDPSIRLIVLFGSVATGNVRSDGFDIDLAVDADRYLSLVSAAEDGPFRVDVVDLRAVSAELRDRILKQGTVLYGTSS